MAIKFTAVKNEELEFCVPEGDYKLKVVSAEEQTSKSGNDMIKLKLRIQNKDGTEGAALFDYLVFSESSLWRVQSFLKACDMDVEEGKDVNIEAAELIGWECEATLSIDIYEGKKSNKVVAYLSGAF